MNKNKIQILILGFIVLLGGLGFYQSAGAAGVSVYVSPATLSKNVGETFNLSVGVNTGQKVCVVEGKLNLNKLSCQSIAVADGVMAQSAPSCSNLYFSLGIPECTTSNKTLFTVNVKAGSSGIAVANFTGVDIIGEGMSVSSASIGGSYTLTSVSIPTTSPTEEKTPEKEVLPKEEISPEKEIAPKEAIFSEETIQPKTAASTTKAVAAVATTPFNLKIILLIVGFIILGLIILWLLRKKRKPLNP